jgi:predicted amidohydrolase YtcJ
MKRANFDMMMSEKSNHVVCGGTIDIDNDSAVTGIFRENALLLITKIMSQSKTDAHKRKFITEGLQLCVQSGLTSVHTNDESCYHIYEELNRSNQLPCRVFLTPTIQDLSIESSLGGVLGVSSFQSSSLSSSSSADDNASSSSTSIDGASETSIKNRFSHNNNNSKDMFSMDRVKLFSDGSLGAETAAIRIFEDAKTQISGLVTNSTTSNPYKGVLTYENIIAMKEDIMKATIRKYRVEIHAIGDAAAEQVLTAMEETHNAVPLYRPILTHCQVLGADLIERMARLGVIADIQPSFVPVSM